jgi:hypothetical protein
VNAGAKTGAAFYCVTGRDFFPGAVALLNSLRLVGHDEPLYVLDHGLEAHQRDRLAAHATVVPAPPGDAPPSMLKLVLPLERPADVVAILDTDLIATRSLAPLIDAAAAGALAGFENDTARHFPEWGDLLGLGEVRPGPYLTTSAIFAAGPVADRVLPLVEDRQREVDRNRTWVAGGDPADPLYFLDQDVLNAVVHSRLEPAELHALDARLAPIPPFAGVRIADRETLRCEHRGGPEPFFLHHAFRKPWLVPIRANVYSRLLTRLLLADDVTLRLDPGELPPRLRDGVAGTASRLAVDARLAPRGALRRLRRRPERVTAWPGS